MRLRRALVGLCLCLCLCLGVLACSRRVVLGVAIPPGQESLVLAMLGGPGLPAGCALTGASIDREHILARYACESGAAAVTLTHPATARPGALVTRQFALAATGAPAPLLPALATRIRAREESFRWIERTQGRPPREGSTRAAALTWLERALTLLFFAALLRELRVARAPRRVGIACAALLLVALAARASLPSLPSNFYSDLPSPFASWRFNWRYDQPLYALASWLLRTPSAAFALNLALGSLAPAFLYRALVEDPPEPGDPAHPSALALPLSLAVALSPLFVRLSATDAPHVAALFYLAAGAWLLRRARAGAGALPLAGALAAAWLVGATRRELALAPLLYGLHALMAGDLSRDRRATLKLLMAAGVVTLAGATLTPVALLQMGNAEVSVQGTSFATWLRALPHALVQDGDHTPRIIPVGLALLAVESVVRRRYGLLLGYGIALGLLTLPYALVQSFAGAARDPLFPPTLSRYALLWYLLPTAAAVLGAQLTLSRRGARFAAVALPAIVALAGVVGLWHRDAPLAFQAEYLFLRDALARETTGTPLVAAWQKNIGMDLCDSLSIPYYALGSSPRSHPMLALGADVRVDAALAALPRPFLYFRGAAVQTVPDRDVFRSEESAAALRRFRHIDCVLREQGRVVARRAGVRVTRGASLFERGDVIDLELLRVEAPTETLRASRCP